MSVETVKTEILDWLKNLESPETIEYLKLVKDSFSDNSDWWNETSIEEKRGIERGLEDIYKGNTRPHSKVKEIYGL